jgi:hypothetical protein
MTDNLTVPSPVNLMALPSRLTSTCSSRGGITEQGIRRVQRGGLYFEAEALGLRRIPQEVIDPGQNVALSMKGWLVHAQLPGLDPGEVAECRR